MADEVFSVLAGISAILDDKALYKQLKMRLDLGNFAASIGSIDAQFCGFFVDEGDPCRILRLTTFNSSSSICQQVGF